MTKTKQLKIMKKTPSFLYSTMSDGKTQKKRSGQSFTYKKSSYWTYRSNTPVVSQKS